MVGFFSEVFEEKYGTKHAVDHMKEMFAWDYASRLGNVNTVGFKIEVNEFDYKAVNKVIYQENGVTIRTIPAIHALDGPVSFILEWNGLKFAFSSDTRKQAAACFGLALGIAFRDRCLHEGHL